MNVKKALITGIGGQDGFFLSQYLLSLGYEVHGIIRRNSVPEHQESRIHIFGDKITTYYGDVTDINSLYEIMQKVQPDEIYNLAAQSHVRISSDVQQYTGNVNAIGVLNMLQTYKNVCPKAKMYQASSSEMFGNSVDTDEYQRETTPMQPVSPYGIAKLYGYGMVRHYRKAYGLHCVSGLLFNHESEHRGSNFVTTKVIKTAILIKMGLADKLELGNIDSYRDWGFSGDYVKAMHLILNNKNPDDYVVATGKTKSVREMCDYVFTKLGMNYKNYVITNEKYMRPDELKYLKGDSSRIKKELGWEAETTFEQLMDRMINHWTEILKKTHNEI